MRLGSLIGLKPEYKERYIILHRHTFPEVLDRIRKSNIRNYSIFLAGGILFSYLEYSGTDYDADMAAIAADPVTRDWWKLTDPMQVPLEGRKDGEWWAQMEEIFHWARADSAGEVSRRAVCAVGLDREAVGNVSRRLEREGEALFSSEEAASLLDLTLFNWDDRIYAYIETAASSKPAAEGGLDILIAMLTGTPASVWTPMNEVFHTD